MPPRALSLIPLQQTVYSFLARWWSPAELEHHNDQSYILNLRSKESVCLQSTIEQPHRFPETLDLFHPHFDCRGHCFCGLSHCTFNHCSLGAPPATKVFAQWKVPFLAVPELQRILLVARPSTWNHLRALTSDERELAPRDSNWPFVNVWNSAWIFLFVIKRRQLCA